MDIEEFMKIGEAWDVEFVAGGGGDIDCIIRRYEFKEALSDGRVAVVEHIWYHRQFKDCLYNRKQSRMWSCGTAAEKLVSCYPTREEALKHLVDACDERIEHHKSMVKWLTDVKPWLEALRSEAHEDMS